MFDSRASALLTSKLRSSGRVSVFTGGPNERTDAAAAPAVRAGAGGTATAAPLASVAGAACVMAGVMAGVIAVLVAADAADAAGTAAGTATAVAGAAGAAVAGASSAGCLAAGCLAAGVAVSSTETALRRGCGEAASDVALVDVAASGEALSAGFWLVAAADDDGDGAAAGSAKVSGSDGGGCGCDGDSMNGVSLASGVCASSRPEFCLRYCGEYELNEPNSGESSQPSCALSSSAAPPRSWL